MFYYIICIQYPWSFPCVQKRQKKKNKNENNIKIKKYVMVFVGHFDYIKKEYNLGGLSYENIFFVSPINW